jgi:hypothetical protein
MFTCFKISEECCRQARELKNRFGITNVQKDECDFIVDKFERNLPVNHVYYGRFMEIINKNINTLPFTNH